MGKIYRLGQIRIINHLCPHNTSVSFIKKDGFLTHRVILNVSTAPNEIPDVA